jgi:hypothetical protein
VEEYLTVNELSSRIKMSPGTIRNLVWQKRLLIGVHYLKPTPRKLLFVWSAVESWLRGDQSGAPETNRGNDNCLIVI